MQRLLVANRGEIALRIFRACASEGIKTVAVVAPDDLGSLHARARPESSRSPRISTRQRWCGRHARARRTPFTPATASSRRALSSRRRFSEPASSGSARRRRRCGPAATSSPRRRRRARPACPSSRPVRRTRSGIHSSSRRPQAAVGAACVLCARPISSTRRSRRRSAKPRPRSATTPCSSSATSSAPGMWRSSCSPTRSVTSRRSASATARFSGGTRRCSRSRRPRRSIRSCARR